jgi:hypothetical protein
MIGYLMRDFVAYWFNHVSGDREFHAVAERMLADAMGRFWSQLETINVLQFLTEDVLEAFRLNIKIFKEVRSLAEMEIAKNPEAFYREIPEVAVSARRTRLGRTNSFITTDKEEQEIKRELNRRRKKEALIYKLLVEKRVLHPAVYMDRTDTRVYNGQKKQQRTGLDGMFLTRSKPCSLVVFSSGSGPVRFGPVLHVFLTLYESDFLWVGCVLLPTQP